MRPAPPAGRGPSPLRGRLAVAAVAVGAVATAGHSLAGLDALSEAPTTAELALAADRGTTTDTELSPAASSTGLDAATSNVLPVTAPASSAATSSATSSGEADSAEGPGQVSAISKAAERRAAQAQAAAEAARPDFAKPAEGRFTSGFGARWGSSHRGIDIAGPIGTPIVSVADGTVVESGPASGFGMWVKVELDDGTINVYGHVNRSYVREGQQVRAGEEIAEIGNRGRSTGPHLHFEVWTDGENKINPLPWLAERGISLGSQQD
ncbi:M23 family metallopeptidase [Actinomycetospora sp. NBC_00405]